MKKWLYPFAAIALIFILASCQEDPKQGLAENESQEDDPVQEEDKNATQNDSIENQDKNQSQNENDEENETKEEETEDKESTTNTEQADEPKEITAPILKKKLSLGISAEKVKSLLGEPNQKVKGAKDGKPLWRYDMKTAEGYSYEAPDNRDDLDYQSFINKDVQLIVFVGIENDKVYSYSIYYYDEEDVPKNYRKNEEYEKTDTMQ